MPETMVGPIRTHRYRGPLPVVAVVAAAGAFLWLASALWIPAKAVAGQYLLQRSWQATRTGQADPSPWPWADTRVVARLQWPEAGSDWLVLEGSSGRNLAWGPTAERLGGDWMIAGHRDTHFRALADIVAGQRLALETSDGMRRFRVTGTEVVDSRLRVPVASSAGDRLLLVTCWPFDATDAGGPLRFVVTAVEEREVGSITL